MSDNKRRSYRASCCLVPLSFRPRNGAYQRLQRRHLQKTPKQAVPPTGNRDQSMPRQALQRVIDNWLGTGPESSGHLALVEIGHGFRVVESRVDKAGTKDLNLNVCIGKLFLHRLREHDEVGLRRRVLRAPRRGQPVGPDRQNTEKPARPGPD